MAMVGADDGALDSHDTGAAAPAAGDEQPGSGNEAGLFDVDGAGDGEKEAKKVRIKRSSKALKLDVDRLLVSDQGLPAIASGSFAGLRFRGKGHEESDLAKLLSHYEEWAHNVMPSMRFDDVIDKVETLGHKQRVKNAISVLRMEAQQEAQLEDDPEQGAEKDKAQSDADDNDDWAAGITGGPDNDEGPGTIINLDEKQDAEPPEAEKLQATKGWAEAVAADGGDGDDDDGFEDDGDDDLFNAVQDPQLDALVDAAMAGDGSAKPGATAAAAADGEEEPAPSPSRKEGAAAAAPPEDAAAAATAAAQVEEGAMEGVEGGHQAASSPVDEEPPRPAECPNAAAAETAPPPLPAGAAKDGDVDMPAVSAEPASTAATGEPDAASHTVDVPGDVADMET